MYIIPSLYIRDQKTVPLATGGTVFDTSPLEMAKKLDAAGAEYLYLFDFDVPPAGVSPNLNLIDKICKETGLKLHISGNIRSADVIERYLHVGAEDVVLGTLAYQKPDFLKSACDKFPKKIGVHIEVRGGKVVIRGWSVATRKTALDYTEQFQEAGVGLIIYSDVHEEGKITTADIKNILDFSRKSPLPFIHGTDVSSAIELELILGLETNKIVGTILSKSMYSGLIDIRSTITHVKEKTPSEPDEPTLIP